MTDLEASKAQYPDKYRDLLDDEIWAFIAKTAKFYPDDAVGGSVERQRETYDALCVAFSFERPAGMKTRDETLAVTGSDGVQRSVGLRHYEPASILGAVHILYVHGGGFVVGGLESHDSICADLSERTGLTVTAVDYALAPEHSFPADFEDSLAAFQHVADAVDRPIVVVGDSAGANLCAAVSHATRGGARHPVGQVLIYPGLGNDVDHGSFVDHARAPGITQADTRFYKEMRVGGDAAKLQDARCCPLIDPDKSNLPPTRVHTAECDPLKDDGLNYAAELKAAGGDVVATDWKGLIHGHLRARNMSKKASECFDAIVADINALAG